MIDVLKTGIYSKITGSAFNTYLSGGLYADEYPQAVVTYPNMIYHIQSNAPTRDSHGYFEPVVVQFNLFSDEDTVVNSKKGNALMDFLVDQFTSVMDDASLSVSGYGTLKCFRISAMPLPKADEATVWGWAIKYLIELEKL